MSNILDRIADFFRPLSGAQKTLFGLLSIGVLMLAGLLFYWALQPSYAVLFRSLSTDSAQTIVTKLKSSGVSYKLGDNGHTIRVPSSKVYDLRLKYAADGASDSDYKGYELFDNNTLGMTDFMQRINKKRALEGELARTINSLKEVQSSRVHIVLPERSPFQQTAVKPSASIVLNIKQGHSLSDKQVRGITALIAGSVEDLTPKEVVILDQDGNQISNNKAESAIAAASSEQIQIREAAEKYLTHKGQSMLNRVVGPGNSILRVSTEHNFNKITRQSNTIDPNSRTIISEEKNNLSKSDRTQSNNSVQTTNPKTTNAKKNQSTVEVKNYEVSKTNEHMENMVGGITHISASVLLNYKHKVTKTKKGKTKTTYVPYSKKQLAQIKQVVHNALGLNDKRGDVLTITQFKFQDAYNLNNQPESFLGNSFSTYDIIRWVLVAIIVGIIGFLMYRSSQKMVGGDFNVNNMLKNMAEPESKNFLEAKTEEDEEEDDIYAQKLSDNAREQLKKAPNEYQNIDNFVDQNTQQAAVLVRRLIKQNNTL